MVAKHERVVETYLVLDLQDILSLISHRLDEVPEDVALILQQVNTNGAHGPRMRLSKDSVIKVVVQDGVQDGIQRTIDRNIEKLHQMKVTDAGDGTVLVQG